MAKLKGARHPLLAANLAPKSGASPVEDHLLIQKNGLKIGVFGVMVPMVTAKMATQAASAYLWTDPIESARKQVEVLRRQVDVLIALTHIGHRRDQLLAEKCPGIDIILGGHSHTVLEQPECVERTWIAQAGSHGRFWGEYEWDGETLSGRLFTFPII